MARERRPMELSTLIRAIDIPAADLAAILQHDRTRATGAILVASQRILPIRVHGLSSLSNCLDDAHPTTLSPSVSPKFSQYTVLCRPSTRCLDRSTYQSEHARICHRSLSSLVEAYSTISFCKSDLTSTMLTAWTRLSIPLHYPLSLVKSLSTTSSMHASVFLLDRQGLSVIKHCPSTSHLIIFRVISFRSYPFAFRLHSLIF